MMECIEPSSDGSVPEIYVIGRPVATRRPVLLLDKTSQAFFFVIYLYILLKN